ncbi:unnamed protein product, partial [Amoebophrya sp. A25]
EDSAVADDDYSDDTSCSSGEQVSGLRLQEKLWSILLILGGTAGSQMASHRKTFRDLLEYLCQSD